MRTKLKKAIQLITIIMIGILMVATVVVFAHKSSDRVFACRSHSATGGIPQADAFHQGGHTHPCHILMGRSWSTASKSSIRVHIQPPM